MGYEKDLRQMLEPLGVYSFEGYSGGEVAALGAKLDQVESEFARIHEDMFPETAEARGLTAMEALFPMVKVSEDEEVRRQRVETLFCVDELSFSANAVKQMLLGCGIDASLTEGTGMKIWVTLNEQVTMADDPVFLMWVLEQLLPCHLQITVVYSYQDYNSGALTQEQVLLETLRARTRLEWGNKLGVNA